MVATGADSTGYRPRLADAYLQELIATFAAVMVTGARATGKTTTAARQVEQIDRLDQPGIAASYRADPDAALRRARRPVLIDEWQEVPEVLAAVKRAVDADPEPGQFILTGSVRADLQTETWAATGRVVRMSMYPLTEREANGLVDRGSAGPSFLDRFTGTGIDGLRLPDRVPDIDGYVAAALRGGFPEVVFRERTVRQRMIWLSSYVDDLVTGDAALLDTVKDPAKLRRYVNALALNNAGMPTDATLYRSGDVTAKTAAGYDELLRNLFVLDIVPAWASNRIARLVKAGKRYMVDAGVAAAAAGLGDDVILHDPDLLGRYFDAFAMAQIRAEVALTHPRPGLHHLRVEAGRREVDLVVELGPRRVAAFEFKAGNGPDWSRREAPVLAAGPARRPVRRRGRHAQRTGDLRTRRAGVRHPALRRVGIGLPEVDPGVVAEHEAGGPGAAAAAADLDILADEGVDDATGVDDAAALEYDRVLDLGAGDLAVVIDGGERADVGVDDPGALADDGRPSDGRTHHLGAGLHHHPAVEGALVVDLAGHVGLDPLQ
ncbi:MAG: ATP-binding protein, partial [Acidimicrobiales bacterium]